MNERVRRPEAFDALDKANARMQGVLDREA